MNFHGKPFPGTKELQGHTKAEGGLEVCPQG